LSTSLTAEVARNGLLAVAVFMALDALVPAGGAIVMLGAGALAAGALAGHHPALFGLDLGVGLGAYAALAMTGTLGYLAGSLIGWAIGRRGGRPFLARWGELLRLGPARMTRAEQWFARHGRWAVLLGPLTPIVRSFVSVPAGVLGTPLSSYATLTFIGSAVWCFGLAAVGWALGSTDGGIEAVQLSGLLVLALAGAGLLLRRRAVRAR
jgi:membrane protein DedA with SNARE-associated domain